MFGRIIVVSVSRIIRARVDLFRTWNRYRGFGETVEA